MKRMKRRAVGKTLISVVVVLMIAVLSAPMVFANSAEPPGLTVIVPFPPGDLALSIRFADGSMADAVQLQKEQKAWEAYYRFFYWMEAPGPADERPVFEGATLIVRSSAYNFDCELPAETFHYYNNLITLNLADKSVTEGQSAFRQISLVSMRVILTLLIEGLVFFAFGYRKKASWAVFLIVNLLTQGALNIALSGPGPGSYWIFEFAFYEALIFIAEMIAFAMLLKEHRKARAAACAFTANLASLLLGGILISYLPV